MNLATLSSDQTEASICKKLLAEMQKYLVYNFEGNVDNWLEYRLPDGSRVDILSENVAFEVDWASKWTEAIGQALFYAEMTNKEPGIILIKRGNYHKNLVECQIVVTKLRSLGIRFHYLTCDMDGKIQWI